ncbi:ABC transporter substrate-binding protein [Salipaludibacillus sp. CUR1]|uniref:ABC transporter substrate-binding protein n=1 Tax=Salipaludibacillus sp. CUR1 TaxID=2820003 RepID=UPI001E323D8F|nr:ABC transporter substrate-binding protein [Salipaludibacillus sp. CUR1]MCE7792695.1 ABC transporter substrate-binding protein [Salipaludibacillus sp. CUR1]
MTNSFIKTIAGVGVVSLLAACGGNDGGNNGGDGNEQAAADADVNLVLYSSMSSEGERNAFEGLIDDFHEENPDIHIEANFPGGSYEDQLRVMMAANDLPDLFDTHGWSQLRYGEYVHDLRDMDWVDDLDPAMDEIIKDEDGKVYTYPMNQAQDGVIYNVDVLEEHGIEPPTTWDDFVAALETIRDETGGQVAPLWIPGGDDWTLAQMVDQLLTPLFVTDENNDYTEEFEDGTFDWTNYEWLAEQMLMLKENDLLNQDVLTAQFAQAPEIMAADQAAFMFLVGSIGPDATEMNPDTEVGLLPTPAIHEGDDPSWIGGERFTLSVSENSEHKEEAKRFIEFMTEEENAQLMAEATNLSSALEHVEADTYFSEYYEEYSHLEIQPYFDRVYLPSGMWDVMATTTAELLADGNVDNAVNTMESEFNRLQDEDDELEEIDEEDIEDLDNN